MKSISLAAALIASTMLSSAVQAASIEQTSDYTYTVVRQHGWHTKTHTRQLNEKQYERLSMRLPERIARMQNQERMGRGRGCFAARDIADMNQTGYSDAAMISQYGSHDQASVLQSGRNDGAYVFQSGNGLDASTIQSGNYDLAFIDQRQRCD